jgi:hypothetical protein
MRETKHPMKRRVQQSAKAKDCEPRACLSKIRQSAPESNAKTRHRRRSGCLAQLCLLSSEHSWVHVVETAPRIEMHRERGAAISSNQSGRQPWKIVERICGFWS